MDATRLKQVPLFAHLDHKELEQLAQWSDEVEVDAGKHLVDQGDFAHEFFVIEEGKADVSQDGKTINQLGPGDWFGEIALEETDRRTASVVATSPMRLIVMLGRDFHEMESRMPDVAQEVRGVIAERLGRGS